MTSRRGPIARTRSRFQLATLLLLVLAGAVHATHDTSAGEGTMIDQAGTPDDPGACGSGGGSADYQETEDVAIPNRPGLLIVAGKFASATTAGATIAARASSGGAPTDRFSVARDGTLSIITGAPDVHLVRHVNLSATSYWFAVRYNASAGVGFVDEDTNADASHVARFTPTGTVGEVGRGVLYKQGGGAEPPSCSVGAGKATLLVYNGSAIPSAPVLSGTVNAAGLVSLSWTVPAGSPTGYNLTRTGPEGTSVRDMGAATSFSETLHTIGVRTYTVTARSGAGDGPASNAVALNVTARPLFGDHGSLYGQGKQVLASAFQLTTSGLDALYGILLTLVFAAAGFLAGGIFSAPGAGAGMGALAGFLIAIAAGMFSLWVIVFVVVVIAGLVMFLRSRGSGVGA